MIAKYDLGDKMHPPTFDFFTWLVKVQSMGASLISLANIAAPYPKFDDSRITFRRIDTIIKPGIAFAGLRWIKSSHGEKLTDCLLGDVPHNFKRLETVMQPIECDYTVTLRNMKKHERRNSDQRVWRKFAAEIGARVIEDYEDKPISLHKRMALYAGAKMNFGVINGPLAMLWFTDYPYTICNCATKMKPWYQHGLKRGDQIPWANERQVLSWDEDVTFEELMERI